MRIVRFLCMACGVMLFSGSVYGQGIALTARAGTLGPGFELTRALANGLNVRIGGSYLPYAREGIYADESMEVRYEAEIKVQTVSALFDWHPFRGTFRLSSGLVYNGTRATAYAEPTEGYTVGQKTFDQEEVGSLSGTIDYASKIAPYLGIGFGNPVHARKRLGLALDLGALYTKAPRIDLEGTGMIAPTAEQDARLSEDLEGIKLYPVLSLGVSVNF